MFYRSVHKVEKCGLFQVRPAKTTTKFGVGIGVGGWWCFIPMAITITSVFPMTVQLNEQLISTDLKAVQGQFPMQGNAHIFHSTHFPVVTLTMLKDKKFLKRSSLPDFITEIQFAIQDLNAVV